MSIYRGAAIAVRFPPESTCVATRGIHAVAKSNVRKIVLLILLCLAGTGVPAADRPLSRDDVTLLLIGGVTSEKMIALIEQRGVDFKLDADLEKKLRGYGADDPVIQALQKAGVKLDSIGPGAPPTPAAGRQATASTGPQPSSAVEKKIAETLAAAASEIPRSEASASTAGPAAKPAVDLSDPAPERIQQILQEFATKEKLFKLARNNYTYHQINKVETVDADGNVDGVYQQEWDILYDDSGKRIERVTYAPVDTLQRVRITSEDLGAMRNIQPFVLTVDELPDYEVKYLGHVRTDELTTYVFSIRPKEIQKGRQYFQGVVWVDDRDLQIVKTEGKTVPELRTKKGENLMPRFTTFREQIDGKFWFPTFTMADDTLYFSTGSVHIKEIIKYTDYKQFKASSTIRMVGESSSEKGKTEPKSPPPKPR